MRRKTWGVAARLPTALRASQKYGNGRQGWLAARSVPSPSRGKAKILVSVQTLASHWYFAVPNLAMATLQIVLVLRVLAGVVWGPAHRAGFARFMRSLTEPVVTMVRNVTPAVVPDAMVVGLAAFWLMACRIVWYFACTAAGMRLSLGG